MHAGTGDPLVGRLIDRRYEVRSRIARGGMATVYEATDLRLDRRVAVKVMHAHLADESQFRERFIQEARSAARLAHPNVVNVFDQGEDGEMAYLVMEYLPSITLRDLLLERGAITPDQSMDVLEAVLAGLSAAHKAGIVHRDLKPENILLANDGRIKIGDFGLARAVTANTATGKALLGTIAYLSPELLTRGIADTRSDIYAVGIMLFEMLTGTQPFTGDQPMQIAYQHANNSVPLPSTVKDSVPRVLDQLVAWSTHRDPNLRPADAREMLDEVQRIRSAGLSEATVTATKAMPLEQEQRTEVIAPAAPTRRNPRPAAALAVADDTGEASRDLRTATVKRRRRAALWIAVVVVAALIAAGLGWWFNFGPGGRVQIPETSGQDPAAAAAALTDLGFQVDEEHATTYDYDVPEGMVVGTDPAAGQFLLRGDTVQLVVSLGRAQLGPPAIEGLDQAEAQQVIEDAGFTNADDEPDVWFSNAHDPGIVITAITPDGANVATLDALEERTALRLVVSAGPLPEGLEGMLVQDAQDEVESFDLTWDVTAEQHDPTVPAGHVISVTYVGSPMSASVDTPVVRPGDRVEAIVSLGPEMIEIPDLKGKSITEAVAALEALGFDVDVQTDVPQGWWGLPGLVQSTNPGAGTQAPSGSTVVLVARSDD